MFRHFVIALTSAATVCALASSGFAQVQIPVGQSSLIGHYDYGDTFTVTGPPGSLVGPANPRPDGYTGSNLFGSYNVEQTFGNPTATFATVHIASPFRFVTPSNATGYYVSGPVTNFPPALGGIFQTGGDSTQLPYGLRDDFVVQFDARMPQGGILFGSFTNYGDSGWNSGDLVIGINQQGALSVSFADPFARRHYAAGSIPPLAHDWRNYAAHFNRQGGLVSIYIDEVLQNVIDLTALPDTPNGYSPRNFGTGAITFGAVVQGAQNAFFDNLQVGAIPEPASSGVVIGALCLAIVIRRHRRQRGAEANNHA